MKDDCNIFTRQRLWRFVIYPLYFINQACRVMPRLLSQVEELSPFVGQGMFATLEIGVLLITRSEAEEITSYPYPTSLRYP